MLAEDAEAGAAEADPARRMAQRTALKVSIVKLVGDES